MLKFYHAPWSRSFSVLWLLEELGVPYEMELVDIRKGAPEEYRRIQPSKKVPAIVHDGTVVTERAAITLYLGENFNGKGLAPKPGDPDRATYLMMLVYHDSVFDPVICAKVQGLTYASNDYPFGTFDDMVANLERILTQRPYIAGDRFTLADIIWGTGIDFTANVLKALPLKPVFSAYLDRVTSRPTFQAVKEKDMELARQDRSLQEMLAKASSTGGGNG